MKEALMLSKQETVDEIKDNFAKSNSAVVVEYRGLDVGSITQLRRELFQNGVSFKVYKNTLVRRALAGSELEELNESLTGPNALAFSEDAVAPSRILAAFAKKNKQLVIKQGVVEGKVVGLDTIKELSLLPNRDGMLAMLLGALQSPLRDLAWAVKQIAEQREASEGETETAPAEAGSETPTENTVSGEAAEATSDNSENTEEQEEQTDKKEESAE